MNSFSPIYQKSIEDLKSLVFESLKEENATVILFGSRARGDFSRASDIDIGILPGRLLKNYLDVQEGIICNSPKSCFKEAFKVGLLSEEEAVKFLRWRMIETSRLKPITRK